MFLFALLRKASFTDQKSSYFRVETVTKLGLQIILHFPTFVIHVMWLGWHKAKLSSNHILQSTIKIPKSGFSMVKNLIQSLVEKKCDRIAGWKQV